MFVLARQLGMTVGDLRRRLSAAEYGEWVALAGIEATEREHAEKSARRRR